MSSSKVIKKPSIVAQLGEETLRLSQTKFLEKKVKIADKAVNEIIEPIRLLWDDLKKQKESAQLKEQGFNNLAKWWLQRLPVNTQNIPYIRRFDPIVKKSGAAIFTLETFYSKFKEVEQKMESMESANATHKKEMEDMDSEPFSFQKLEAEVVKIEARITRAAEVKHTILALEEEWIAARQKIISDLDEGIYKVNALIQKTYVTYGDLN